MAKAAVSGGGKKGGKKFPRVSLSDAVDYARKLVSRTFTAPQPRAIIFKGVFNNVGPTGEERSSALRQFGLLEGSNAALTASQTARQLAHATGAQQVELLRTACLTPKVFKMLYDTYQGDTVSVSQLRQQAAQVGVHVDTAEKCVDLFVSSLLFARLATSEGEQVRITPAADLVMTQDETPATESQPEAIVEVPDPLPEKSATPVQPTPAPEGSPSARSVIHVNVNLDSSLDTEKLQKQLELLRRYGAI